MFQNDKLFILDYTQRLKDQYMQNWRSKRVESRKLCTYRDFKIYFGKEPYLNVIDLGKFRKCMASFRFFSHDLMIEK